MGDWPSDFFRDDGRRPIHVAAEVAVGLGVVDEAFGFGVEMDAAAELAGNLGKVADRRRRWPCSTSALRSSCLRLRIASIQFLKCGAASVRQSVNWLEETASRTWPAVLNGPGSFFGPRNE